MAYPMEAFLMMACRVMVVFRKKSRLMLVFRPMLAYHLTVWWGRRCGQNTVSRCQCLIALRSLGGVKILRLLAGAG
jgi:hypothetical protein